MKDIVDTGFIVAFVKVRDLHHGSTLSAANLSLHGAHKYGFMQAMKTTLEIPDTVFRRAKMAAASRGVTFREFVTEAVREKLVPKKGSRENKPGWTKVFGAAKQHSRELQRMDALIEAEFEQIDPEDEP